MLRIRRLVKVNGVPVDLYVIDRIETKPIEN